jgi:pimeloyl-ACP methyl ester carboxylesterase
MGARRNGQNLEQHMSEYDAQQIRNIVAPVLVVHAPDDTLISYEQGTFAAGRIPGAQFVPMERGGHLAFMMNANNEAIERIRQFLKQHNSR